MLPIFITTDYATPWRLGFVLFEALGDYEPQSLTPLEPVRSTTVLYHNLSLTW